MNIREHKSALASLAALGVTAVAAGATAFVKIRRKRQEQRRMQELDKSSTALSAEQMMVYNEAISVFLDINSRIYEQRRQKEQLQPVVRRLTLESTEKPDITGADDNVKSIAESVEKFLAMQVPFINACLAATDQHNMTYADCVRGPVGARFDNRLDEEPTGADVKDGDTVEYVLRLGYFFPDSTIAPHPVKSVCLLHD